MAILVLVLVKNVPCGESIFFIQLKHFIFFQDKRRIPAIFQLTFDDKLLRRIWIDMKNDGGGCWR